VDVARESRDVWLKRVERWRESGLRANEFAAELGVNAATLAEWKYRLAAKRYGRMLSTTLSSRPRSRPGERRECDVCERVLGVARSTGVFYSGTSR
jgi:hypothetical protein